MPYARPQANSLVAAMPKLEVLQALTAGYEICCRSCRITQRSATGGVCTTRAPRNTRWA